MQIFSSGNQILSPKSDVIFKRIFGIQDNVDILGDFLKSVLDLPEDEYECLTIVDPHLRRENPDDKLGILDVKLHTRSAKIINIEIQVLQTWEMRERIVFYLAKMITEQINKSEAYISLKKVISILITDYRLIEENEAYHNRYHLYDPKTSSEFSDIIEVNTLELPKLPGKNDNTVLWDWMHFFKSRRKEEFDMLAQNNPQIKKAVGILMELSADEQTRLLYESREKARWDEMARLHGARAEAEAKAEAAVAKAEAAVAKAEAAVAKHKSHMAAIVKNLLQDGLPQDKVATLTGLSLDEVKHLSIE